VRERAPTLFSSILRGYLWVMLILAVIAPLILLSTFRKAYRERAVDDLARSAEALVPVVSYHLLWGDMPAMESVLTETAARMDARVTVIAADGTVCADSEKDPGEMENHRTRPEIIAAFNGVTGTSSRYSATLDREMIYVAVPVKMNDSIPAVVRTSVFFESHTAAVNRVMKRMVPVVLAALAAALVSAWLISRRIAVPLGDLAGVADRVASGELAARAAPGHTQEHNRLAAATNKTLERTERLIRDLSISDSRNLAILQSMSEGVVVVSSRGSILLMNQSFREIFKMSGRTEELPPEVRSLLGSEHGGEPRGRFDYQGKVIAWTCAPVEDSRDRVFSFRDVTKEFNLSEIKRNFAINVSHELRTPLTAIKGYAETLREDVSGENSRYIDVIMRNTERLIALVRDIQILSEVESGENSLSLEPVPVEDMMGTVLPLFESRAEEKGLALSFVNERPDLAVMADRYRVEQILVNLIDNALKYTDQGGVEVRVSSRGDSAVFAVSDTGRGIPAELQERVFERFFVVDRSRSRKLGGTGLGLAICKHIVEAHRGTISVTSTPGGGSIFLFTIPIAT